MTDIFSIIRTGSFSEYVSNIEKTGVSIKNSDGANPLHMAIAYGKSDIALDLLARGIDVNETNDEGMTSFTTSIIGKNWPLTNEILKKKPDVNVRDNYGNNSLWYATLYSDGRYDFVNSILSLGGDPLTKNKAGRSPLDLAEKLGDNNLIELLSKYP